MKLILPKSFSVSQIHSILTDFSNHEDDEIQIDLTELEYIDSGSANYIILLPFYFRSFKKKVSIIVNSKANGYQFIKKVGIIEELENNFNVTDISSFIHTTKLTGVIAKYQNRIADILSADPFFRTFLANNDKDRKILKTLSIEYKNILESSQSNDLKITRCLTELIDNIFQHSEQVFGAISVHHIFQGKIPFLFVTVTDLGIGFKESLLKSKRFKSDNILSDEEYIKASLQVQVSATDSLSRGFGLPTVARYCDRLSISSGMGNLALSNDGVNSGLIRTSKNLQSLNGANIVCILKLDENSLIVNPPHN
jgi:anti-sigma regulatory factor (Ser/Thr protein kinase)